MDKETVLKVKELIDAKELKLEKIKEKGIYFENAYNATLELVLKGKSEGLEASKFKEESI